MNWILEDLYLAGFSLLMGLAFFATGKQIVRKPEGKPVAFGWYFILLSVILLLLICTNALLVTDVFLRYMSGAFVFVFISGTLMIFSLLTWTKRFFSLAMISVFMAIYLLLVSNFIVSEAKRLSGPDQTRPRTVQTYRA